MTRNRPHRPTRQLLAGAALTLGLIVAGPAYAAETPAKPTEAPRSQEGKRVPATSLPAPGRKHKKVASASDYEPAYLSPSAVCNYSRHDMAVSSLLKFNLGRFPSGAHVYIQYAFARVNSAGYYISQARIGNWRYEGFVQPNIHTEYGAPGQGYITSYDWTRLAWRSTSYSWGHWVVWARAAIWNGSYWELTRWTGAQHESYDRFGGGGTASSCWISLSA